MEPTLHEKISPVTAIYAVIQLVPVPGFVPRPFGKCDPLVRIYALHIAIGQVELTYSDRPITVVAGVLVILATVIAVMNEGLERPECRINVGRHEFTSAGLLS